MRRERPSALTGRPRVSVVVPCYNYGRFLPDAVSSVLDQTQVDVDVLIVDDASTDGSAEVARRLARCDSRVRVLEHARNRGHLRTYNDGLTSVDGDYLVLLSADDLLSAGSLARSLALLETHPEVGFTYGYALSCAVTPPRTPGRARSWFVWDGPAWVRRLSRTGRNVVRNPEVVMRRSVFEQCGNGYDLTMPHTADMYLWLRAARIADVGRVNGNPQAYYRIHGDNMHLTRFDGALTDMQERLVMWDALFVEADDAPAHRRVRRALARQSLDFAADALADGPAGLGAAAEFRSFALATCPDVAGTRAWRSVERRSGGGGVRSAALATEVRELRYSLRWRRWRRFGV